MGEAKATNNNRANKVKSANAAPAATDGVTQEAEPACPAERVTRRVLSSQEVVVSLVTIVQTNTTRQTVKSLLLHQKNLQKEA